jgi:hypothetical protein
MVDITEYNENNYVDYNSSFERLAMCKIINIDKNDDGNIIDYTLRHRDKGDFEANSNELRPILFTPDHLKKLGFTYNSKDEFYSLITITMFFSGYEESRENGFIFNSATMWLFKDFPDYYNQQKLPPKDFLNQNTIDVRFLHYFQNICRKQERQIDFSALEN